MITSKASNGLAVGKKRVVVCTDNAPAKLDSQSVFVAMEREGNQSIQANICLLKCSWMIHRIQSYK